MIFKNWPETIDAVMEHFQTPGGVSGFGDWSSILEELDPFRDGKARQRIGEYIKCYLNSIDKGKSRDHAIKCAAINYAEKWGEDKVVLGL